MCVYTKKSLFWSNIYVFRYLWIFFFNPNIFRHNILNFNGLQLVQFSLSHLELLLTFYWRTADLTWNKNKRKFEGKVNIFLFHLRAQSRNLWLSTNIMQYISSTTACPWDVGGAESPTLAAWEVTFTPPSVTCVQAATSKEKF